ncbi:MAG: 6-phosphofructokinase [Chloroflexi bacterium]|nr:6-phosphofructokinase [Chloroflexota bacterium]
MSEPKLVVGQSGGPTPVINASLAGVLDEAVTGRRFPEVYGLRHGIEGALGDQLIPLDGLSREQIDTLARTPAAALGSCRRKLGPEDYGRVLDTFRRHDVHWLCYTGGNDSMDTCERLRAAAQQAGYDLAVYGVPKTIDNDLVETDHSPGYGSAARYWAIVTQEVTLDVASMRTYDRVVVLECMGRDAGWLTAATALLKRDERDGPHVLLTPERPFDAGAFLKAVEAALSRTGYCVVATAETIRDTSGQFVAGATSGADHFGHPIVTAVGETLARMVSQCLSVKARAVKPGTLQRSSALHVSPVDREEAREAGRTAARRLAGGRSGEMVALLRPEMGPYRCEYGGVPLPAVANRERRLPSEFLAPGYAGVTAPFLAYGTPLIGPKPEPYFRLV